MILEIFDVEHGACALLTTSGGKRVMIDCGTNSTTGWKPAAMLQGRDVHFLERLVITNYDEDHVAGFEDLHSKIPIGILTRNPLVAPNDIRYLKSEDGMGGGINALIKSIENTFTGGFPVPENLDFNDTFITCYCNPYSPLPIHGYFSDENNLSLVTFVSCGEHKIVFPGDIEKEGWKALLVNPMFRLELASVNLFVASHHGRENGFCKEVLNLCPRIQAVVISDKKLGHQTQETVPQYRSYAQGFTYAGQTRHVLTTRNDGNMRFDFPAIGPASVLIGCSS